MARFLLATCVGALWLFPGLALADSQSFAPVADSYVEAANPDSNYGHESRLRVQGGFVASSYLLFDLKLPPGATITDARLRLYTGAGSTLIGYQAYAVTSTSWDEETITYGNAPAFGAQFGTSGGWSERGYKDVELPDGYVQAGLNSLGAGTGAASAKTFWSREAGANPPQLVVTYAVPPTNTSRPTLSGTARDGETLAADPGAWQGTEPISYAYQWRRCDTAGANCTDIAGATEKTYTLGSTDVGATVRVAVTATNSADSSSATSAPSETVAAPAAVIAAAGDIADDGSGDEATAKLLDAINPNRVLTLGDNAYPDGTLEQFNSYYEPTWGRHKSVTRPSPGNHDYHVSGAPGYFDYFGTAAGERGKGYYSYDVGAWHMVALNSNISAAAGSAQEQWLRADLAAHPNQCTLAYWHHPRFTSGSVHGNNTSVAPLWQALYDGGAEVVLNGHNHNYERFAPQDPSGQVDPQKGIREFVVGSGGSGHYGFGTPKPTSEVRNGDTYGVLKLALRSDGYDWKFEPQAGKTFTDTGTGGCHSAPTPTPTPEPSPSQYPFRGVYDREEAGTFDAITARGFNLIDSGPDEVDGLAGSGARALLWVGDYDNATCSWEMSDATLRSHVTALSDNPDVGVWFFSDEPDPAACPSAPAQHKARSDLIRGIDSDTPTLVVADGNSGQASLAQLSIWRGTADVIGLNPYPCYQGRACDYDLIGRTAAAADAAGLRYWGVAQAFGDPPGAGQWRLPTPAELHEIFERWRATNMEGYLAFAWRWPAGDRSQWLANHRELQDQLAEENKSD